MAMITVVITVAPKTLKNLPPPNCFTVLGILNTALSIRLLPMMIVVRKLRRMIGGSWSLSMN